MKLKLLWLLLAVKLSTLPAMAADIDSQNILQPPWVKITTVGGNTQEGALLNLRFSGYYGTGQCPGLVFDPQNCKTPQFVLNVGGERRTFNYLDIKQIRVEWTDSYFDDCREPKFTLEDKNGTVTIAKPSWLSTTSTSDASLIVNGKVIVISARPDAKTRTSDLISSVEFKHDVTINVGPDIADLQKTIDEQAKVIQELKLQQEKDRQQISILGSENQSLQSKLASVSDHNKRLLIYNATLENKLKNNSSPTKRRT